MAEEEQREWGSEKKKKKKQRRAWRDGDRWVFRGLRGGGVFLGEGGR